MSEKPGPKPRRVEAQQTSRTETGKSLSAQDLAFFAAWASRRAKVFSM